MWLIPLRFPLASPMADDVDPKDRFYDDGRPFADGPRLADDVPVADRFFADGRSFADGARLIERANEQRTHPMPVLDTQALVDACMTPFRALVPQAVVAPPITQKRGRHRR